MKLQEVAGYSEKEVDDLAGMTEKIAKDELVSTFLTVKRSGIVSDENTDGEEPPVLQEARKRAYEVAALLAVVMLTQSKYHTTCGLAEQMHVRPDHLAMFDVDDGGYWVQRAGIVPESLFGPEEDVPLSREGLKRLLFQRQFKPLSEVMITKKSELPKSIQRTLQQATLRLADAIHSSRQSSQLLGAVTTLEILFTLDEGEKYDVSRQRVIALLGKSAAANYQIQEILKTRHLYVHQGREVEDDGICYEAVMLALSCLLHYIPAAARFSDKPHFIRYLDMLFKAEQISDGWNEAEQRAFKRLLRHKREPIIVPLRTLY